MSLIVASIFKLAPVGVEDEEDGGKDGVLDD